MIEYLGRLCCKLWIVLEDSQPRYSAQIKESSRWRNLQSAKIATKRPWTKADFKESPTASVQELLQDLVINIELNEELKDKREQALISIHISWEFTGILWA